MYLPAEGVYYELVCNRIGGDANPVEHAQKRKVFPVSPNTFYTYLLTSPRASRASRSRSTPARS